MTKQDWIRKLTSRKFWVAVAALVGGLVGFLKNPTTDTEVIASLILSLGAVVAYIAGEGMVDAAHAGGTIVIENEPEEHPPEAGES